MAIKTKELKNAFYEVQLGDIFYYGLNRVLTDMQTDVCHFANEIKDIHRVS